MSFNITFNKASDFKKIIDGVKDLISDFNIDFSPDGIYIQFMDTAVVSMCEITMHKNYFKSYDSQKNVQLGINCSKMGILLKCIANDNEMTFLYKEGSDKIEIRSCKKDEQINFKMNLITIENSRFDVPEMIPDSEFEMSSKDFKKICTDLATLDADVIDVGVSKDKLTIKVNGALAEVKLIKQAGDEIDIKHTRDISSNFSMKYMLHFCKLFTISNNINIQLTQNNPMRVKYDIGNKSEILFFLAPSMDEDDDDDEFME